MIPFDVFDEAAPLVVQVEVQDRPRPGRLPFEVLREVTRLGVRLEAKDGAITASPPGRLPVELRAQLAETKPVILAMIADPRSTACGTWEAAIAQISTWWEAAAGTVEPAGVDDVQLTDAVREAILATVDHPSLVAAILAVEAWGRAWVRALAEGDPSRDWRHLAPDGQPWLESAYWRCPDCQGTFAPCEYLPNSKRLCRGCMRAEAGTESPFELPLPPAPATLPDAKGAKRKRPRKPDSDLERSRCPKCRRLNDREVMLWVGSGEEAARWCMGCALKLEAGRAGPPPTSRPRAIEEFVEGPLEEVEW